jgi:hypothetical protein
VARIVLALAALTPALFAACGGGDDVPEGERARQVSGVAELAANAYAAAGADGLYDYLSSEVVANCSKQGLATALADQPVPEGFVRTSNVNFDGDKARAKIVQRVQDGAGTKDVEVEWTFVSAGDSWRLSNVPGLERCSG